MTSSDRSQSAELLTKKHLEAGLASEEGYVRMLVVVNLLRTSMQLATRSDAYHRQYGWSWAGFRLLVFLWSEGDLEIRRLAELSMSTRAAVSSAVNKLEAAGMVRRKPVPDDRRLVVVQLTDAGRVHMEPAMKGQLALEEELLSSLCPDQQRQLMELLRTVADAVDTR
ncbi:MarR family winged helix-turn-helix transcriptional regulator [Streptomyces sp. NPDC006602]|uniref:MarR family winged helix-turn-helix transcriptional regulator n=1 Tax=Streptomyces sp. NPDC006602 TaxID=3364751 RepID=UPI00369D89E1